MTIVTTFEPPDLFVLNLGEHWTWLDLEQEFETTNVTVRTMQIPVYVILYSDYARALPGGSPFVTIRRSLRNSPPNIAMTYIVSQTMFTRMVIGAVLKANPTLHARMTVAPTLAEARRLYAERHTAARSR